MGGWIAQLLALHEPSRVHSMVLLCPATDLTWHISQLPEARKQLAATGVFLQQSEYVSSGGIPLSEALIQDGNTQHLLLHECAAELSEKPTPAHAEQDGEGQRGRIFPEPRRMFPEPRQTFPESRRRLLQVAIECPVHILHGMQDEVIPWEESTSLAQSLSSASVVVELVKDADHRLSRPQDIARLLTAVEGSIQLGSL
eukprot:CAMPEP_0198203004 /NCGR_PEP_ID=MMETSP1445-20131203/6234_1 /TAXON_ID=36898 /ORGANISM="Pyramimonas sp., Strain CCMP2087" /LENGTH=198 /DNA_ID=CAMNT_0043874193 /DNA_START=467 /DNA_END=1063 /DNA_ORIENTATION=-